MRGFRQFDAPVSIVLTYEKVMEPAAVSQFDQQNIVFCQFEVDRRCT